jgi:hypothetical protein
VKHPSILRRGRVVGLVGVMLAAAFGVVLGPAAPRIGPSEKFDLVDMLGTTW